MAHDATAAFDPSIIEPHMEQHRYAVMRRREEALRLIAEYEANHGKITESEVEALRREVVVD